MAKVTPERELLEIVWQGTAGMPDVPHIRNRTRLQELIALRAIELGEVELATGWAARITNWRRGVVHAELGLHFAKAGRADEALQFLVKAADAAEAIAAEAEAQAWYCDRIRARVALGYHTLGKHDEAVKFVQGMVDSEIGPWMLAIAIEAAETRYEDQLAAIDDTIAKGGLEPVMHATAICTQLYDRWCTDAGRRTGLERRMLAAAGKMAPTPAIQQLTAFAAVVAKHDAAKAHKLVADLDARIHAIRWHAGDELGLCARLATVLAIGGDKAAAVVRLDELMQDYGSQREAIENLYRADALVPIAEAYAQAGSPAQAETVYRRAIQEALANPNSRPRLDDLAGIALSLTHHAAAASATLIVEVRAAARGLGAPW